MKYLLNEMKLTLKIYYINVIKYEIDDKDCF